ncbi:UNVERIFIED_CONTAM: hypothetical protein Sradi_5527200 [Sesamum radiatum]|uniref:Reverse transcriptase zinc-binding domain-containing protein n=1 Tax=Sesamum radiatum TaxID=300843 RepID=A0AAW2LBL4_SESRA
MKIRQVVQQYFEHIFKSTAANGAMISEVINAMETPVMNNMNAELIRSSTANEYHICRASEEALGCIKRMLRLLEQASRLKNNLDKSVVIFNKNVMQAQRALLANILGIQVVAKHVRSSLVASISHIPTYLSPRVPSSNVKVAILLAGGDWNENLVHAEFKEDDASCILSIPFPDQPGHDEIVWHYERSRTISVEQKVHLFAWKVCKNAFPTVCNLKKQEVEVKDGCVLYDAKEETVLHALLLCPFARLVWALSSLHGWSFPNMRAGWKEWMRGVHRELDREDFALFVLISWRLWYSRNKWIFLRRDIAEARGIEYG